MLRIIGRIYTGLMAPATTDAVLVGDDGKIVATGEAAKRGTGKMEEISLGARVACPGFVDAHVHLEHLGRELMELDLGGTTSLDDVLARVRDASAKLAPDRVLFGSGWDESTWERRDLPVRKRLDAAAPGRAVVLRRVCGHLWAVSSETLNQIAARTDLTPAQRERLVALSADGILREDDLALAAPIAELSPEERREGLRLAMRRALSLGITAAHDMSEAGRILAGMGELPIRVVAAGLGIVGQAFLPDHASGNGDRQECLSYKKRLHPGPIKLFLDGSIGAHTAAVTEPFLDEPANCGMLLRETSDLVRELRGKDRAISLHAIGDRAISQAIDVFEALAENGDSPLNSAKGTVPIFRVEHAEIITPALIERMAALGVIASMQPNFVGRWQMAGQMYEQRFGARRASGLNPFGSVLGAGIPLAFGSDCMPMDPLFGIRSAMNHPLESERLTFVEALHAYTLGAAEAGKIGEFCGSIEPGKEADIVVLSADPALGDTVSVEQTYVAGRLI